MWEKLTSKQLGVTVTILKTGVSYLACFKANRFIELNRPIIIFILSVYLIFEYRVGNNHETTF